MDDPSKLVPLSQQECLRLLRGHPVHLGRLGVTDADGQPLVMPVNYRMAADRVVFRTQTTSILAERAAGHRVAFEVDEVNVAWREGWSVLVQGSAQPVTDPDELAWLRRLNLQPWAPGERELYLRIEPRFVTGRRIV